MWKWLNPRFDAIRDTRCDSMPLGSTKRQMQAHESCRWLKGDRGGVRSPAHLGNKTFPSGPVALPELGICTLEEDVLGRQHRIYIGPGRPSPYKGRHFAGKL
jgi:hypothetical protein